MEQRVIEIRRRYPDWGARKLEVLLSREGVELPAARSTEFFCATTWSENRNGGRRCSASNEVRPTNYGRWILKVPNDGT